MSDPRKNQRINCRVNSLSNGGKHLVFEVDGTKACVGEIRLSVTDAGYLPVMAELFSRYVSGAQPADERILVGAAVRRVINGR